MPTCNICSISGIEKRLFDGISEGRLIILCERCSIIENIPLIKKPNANQLKDSETLKVSETMRQLSGFKVPAKKETFFKEDKLQELNKNPELETPEKDSLNLIEHFHWEVMKNRRRKGLSQQQLAEAIGESEIAIQMIEKAKLPDNAETLIKKLEQFFQTNFRINSEPEIKPKEPILLDNQGKEIEIIPEEEMIFIEDEDLLDPENKTQTLEQQKQKLQKQESIPIKLEGELDLKKINQDRVTIGDLQELHKKTEQTTKQEEIEEQQKIEERRKILENLREKDRLKIEERKRQEQLDREAIEQERINIIQQKQRELQEIKKQESKDIDKYLGGAELLNPEKNQNNNKEDLDSKSYKEFDDELN